MKLGLDGKKALITGGATGLGQQFVMALAKEGVTVAFSYYNEKEHPEVTEKEVAEHTNSSAYGIQADLSKVEEARQLFNNAKEKLGKIDILINNAGVWLTGAVTDIKPEDWDKQLETNLRGPFLLCQEFAQAANKEGHGGHVLNITSQAAYHGSTTGHSHYAASKAGLIAFNASFAREQAKKNINSNNIAIGIMHTKMIQENLDKDPNYYVNRIPKGRVVEPEEIAKMGTLIVSDVFDYMTGATIDLTGGMLMH
ncbi:SDR family NAD(P)-dependent oxidoreductase [Tetragenococcus koreensis]|uniref:3-oxoacyl-ACP reductase n=1 Tax=Tetragenococcus koreensis TaxID=290335 RepID=A0AAN4UCW6_9ENTE|nr:SDR family oxidoreductase [Tetragenococcus koreensis]GEQ50150.1 3-oxoacyl-ACP reductase [Tetragenococcus koreensis]GEQ52600.1 3-oxoacyl-ACP reductase [Tetragenococcus koreensis]GEQ55135.1 3-oxoacyl-ACP reductase [Tetragenococcus koreensis]GEQ57601.1 3-oxoacyl-ACP reductase [Tetragenococcus koreensis]GEQ60164.1 3-oxoacyl-ACP reductase [Tetragenococcus koreensis]